MSVQRECGLGFNVRRYGLGIGLVVGLFFGATGCGKPPAVEHHNLTLVASLRTALSARNTTWLDGVERAVEARVAEGRMSSPERDHFRQLIAQARDGQWQAAEQACLQFEAAQANRHRPAAGDSAAKSAHRD